MNLKPLDKNHHIFIIGESRSGKTLLGNLISIHNNTYWFSNYTDKFPNFPILSFIHRIRDIPGIGKIVKNRITKTKGSKFIPRPSEGGNIYSNCKFEHNRWSTEKDLTDYQELLFREIIESHNKFTGKSCFVNDQSANIQRIRQIVKIFPKAKFIHVIRDGRVVAYEMAKTDWWSDHSYTPWFGEYKHEHAMGKSVSYPVSLCGLHWKKNVETILENLDVFQGNYIEIRYEDMVKDTTQTILEVLDFCGLKWYKEYLQYIPEKLPNNNNRYFQHLTREQIDELNYLLGDLLTYYRYH